MRRLRSRFRWPGPSGLNMGSTTMIEENNTRGSSDCTIALRPESGFKLNSKMETDAHGIPSKRMSYPNQISLPKVDFGAVIRTSIKEMVHSLGILLTSNCKRV